MTAMRASYEKELQDVKDNMVLMGRHIEIAIEKCSEALESQSAEIAQEVYAYERLVDKFEREIEHSCLRILLMENPVASDFHDITAALKMITDLERIGDQTRDIADIAMQLSGTGCIKKLDHVQQMTQIVTRMVKDGVSAYINRDLDLARSLETADNNADALFNFLLSDLIALIKKDPTCAEQAAMLMMVTKYLERIGDHAVNIGEWVEYAITGSHPKQ